MELKFDDEIIVCKKKADVLCPGDDVINHGISIIENYFERVQIRTGIFPVDISIFMYENDRINAFSKKHKGEYVVGISTAAFLELWNWFKLWFASPKMYEIFEKDKSKKEKYIERCYDYALMFLAAHELYHILNGHCDLPEKDEKFIFEQSERISEERKMFEQGLEYDADCCGVACCVNQMFYDLTPVTELINFLSDSTNVQTDIFSEELDLLSFSIYSIFLLFSNEEQIDFKKFINGELYAYDHPNAGIRYVYVLNTIATILYKNFKECEVKRFLDSIVKKNLMFDKIMLNKENLKNLLIAQAFSEKGQSYILDLHNSWEHIAEKLKPYAKVNLAPFEKIETKNVFFDEKGEVIRCISEIPPTESV